jgi:hypothetical protein
MQRCRPDDLGREAFIRKVVASLEENQTSTIVNQIRAFMAKS